MSAGGLGVICATDRAWQDLMRERRGDSLATVDHAHASGWHRGPVWSRWRSPAPFPGHVWVFPQRDRASATALRPVGRGCRHSVCRLGPSIECGDPSLVFRFARPQVRFEPRPCQRRWPWGHGGGLGRPCTYDPPSVSPSATEEREGSCRKWANGCRREDRRGKKRMRFYHPRQRRRDTDGNGGWAARWRDARSTILVACCCGS